jgi:NADPH:quinone reductase-like Zn-dependent oxidoreductase
MKAAVVEKYGKPEGLKIVDVEKPVPKANEILVKVQATTVTFGDAWLRRMKLPSRLVFGLFMGGLGKGKILGHEFAGEVEAVGDEATRFKIGDDVFGSAGMKGGTYSEYISVAEERMVVSKPNNISFEESAAVPIGGNTALHILNTIQIESGQKVLVNGASGSVGTYAVQLAKHYGATVIGVCSTVNLEWVRDLGCEDVIDYTQSDFTTSDEKYDVIFDTVRKLSHSKVKESLTQNGTFLSTSSSTEETVENLQFLKELIEAEKVKPVIDRTYSLDDIAKAHSYVDSGHKKGNVVITVA